MTIVGQRPSKVYENGRSRPMKGKIDENSRSKISGINK